MEYSGAVATEVFYKKGVLRNYAKFTGKNLYQSLFFNKVAGLRLIKSKSFSWPWKISIDESALKILEINEKEQSNQSLINNEIHNFCESLLKREIQKTSSELHVFLKKISVPKISWDQLAKFNNKITNAPKYISSDKTPGNERLTKEFYKTFCEDI